MGGIPYMGSKRVLAQEIINIIYQRHGNIPFYDLFGGGGAVSFSALSFFDDVHYNEIDTSIVNLMRQLKEGIPESWYEPVTREKFVEEIKKDTAYAGMVKTCWGFGNNYRKGYLWGIDIMEDKLLLHDLCVKNTPELIYKANEVFNINLPKNLPGGCIKNRMLYVKRFFDRMDLQSLERLESLQRLQRLERMQRLGRLPNKLKLSNKDYQDIKFKNDSVIY